MHVIIKELPESLQSVLRTVGYRKKDISVVVKEKESLHVSGGAGLKGFAIVVDLATGEKKRFDGSWGGANMFSPTNAVDLNDEKYTLPHNCAVVKGHIGSYTYATLTVAPSNAAPWLSSGDGLVTEKERAILYAYGSLKSGPYRRDELARIKATESEIESLVSRGLLKKDGRGIQISTLGKNSYKHP